MEIKTYRAASMQEALSIVRTELGPTAAILHTREVHQDRLFGLWRGPRQIEVTASTSVNVPPRVSRSGTVAGTSRWRSHSPYHESEQSGAPETYSAPPAPTQPRLRPAEVATTAAAAVDPSPLAQQDELKTQLRELQSMVEDLCARTRQSGHQDLSGELFHVYTSLIDAELDDEMAKELVNRLKLQSPGESLADVDSAKARIAQMLEEEITVTGPLQVTSGTRRVVALVGPTGVGKTTTIAKLAANYRLREKHKVGLITVDTYRIAAVEQLRTYADIIDLPMHVVSTPREMRDAVARMSDLDLVLIDTAGRSPRDQVKIQELKAFLTEAQADEVHLVLSSTTSGASLSKTAQQFATAGTTALVLTKLDEALGLGGLLPLVRSCHLPLSYLTDGQNVPDDIAPAKSDRLARAIVGLAQHQQFGV